MGLVHPDEGGHARREEDEEHDAEQRAPGLEDLDHDLEGLRLLVEHAQQLS
jgi:hypothetical protein